MYTQTTSAILTGVKSSLVNVETDLSSGIPYFVMTGVLAAEVKEAGERVKTAIRNSGYTIPSCRIVVNISPAGIRKAGTALDLPMAVGILADLGIVPQSHISGFLLMGELSLNGSLNPVKGVLPAVSEGYPAGIQKCIVPWENAREARLFEKMQVYPARTLNEVIQILKNPSILPKTHPDSYTSPIEPNEHTGYDFADIYGQFTAKRAAMIAAAGHHNLLYIGPPGSGKSMLASCIPGILPTLTNEESLEISSIYSAAGLLRNDGALMRERPFRAVHHSVTRSALIGGGRYPSPGEITLAHGGVLFLDELPFFHTEVLESLRIPLEQKQITIIRNGQTIPFPADFMLVAAMNPCKCGYFPDRNRCSCTELEISRYIGRISSPLLDRFDMSVRVDKPQYGQMAEKMNGFKEQLTTKKMKEQVERASEIQRRRYRSGKIHFNAGLTPAGIKKYCELDKESSEMMEKLYERWNLSARGYHKILKVARTIADLEGAEHIEMPHLSEAAAYRSIDWKGGE